MSAHAKLAAMTAARGAMTDLLARIGMPDAARDECWRFVSTAEEAFEVRAQVLIADKPVNDSTQVVAVLIARCILGKKASVAGHSMHMDDEGFQNFCDYFRFDLSSGKGFMAPRTLARMVLSAMKKEAA
jgi:hypothetical protein